jgi:hypothetical protein
MAARAGTTIRRPDELLLRVTLNGPTALGTRNTKGLKDHQEEHQEQIR